MRYFTSILFLFSIFFISCNDQKKDFDAWHEQLYKSDKDSENSPEEYTVEFLSTDLLIDTIYRSMQGPYEIKPITIDASSDELIWVTAYESRVLQAESKVHLGAAFMCHNNLDYAKPDQLPWELKTSGANHRIFTLSQGQSKIVFPKGYGIPIPSNQPLNMVSQVLNHHRPELFINTRHLSILNYKKESELDAEMTPLYQQAVFVTQQTEGSEGSYGTPIACLPYHKHENGKGEAEIEHDCSIEYDDDAAYNPYKDKYGRKYTGHWILPYGKDTIKTNVTKMLDLDDNSRIHLISVHLHPFASALELWDISEQKMLYSASFTKDSLGFGFKNIDYYSSKEGIPVFTDHQYELVSAYNCTDSLNEHTAMAVMYLYLED